MRFLRILPFVVLSFATALSSDSRAADIGAHGLRLPASFTGPLPCADCAGIAYHLDLWPDQSYHLRRVWLKDGEANSLHRDEVGLWYAEPDRNAMILYGAAEMPLQWEIEGPDRLRRLDIEGNPIRSELNYSLTSNGSLAETDLTDLFLGGMMIYMADAAIFRECMTGRSYPIAQEADYLALERAYLADAPAGGRELYVHVEGDLVMRPAMEGPDRRALVVKRFIKTRPGITCERQRANAGLTNTYWRIDRLENLDVVTLPDRREPHILLRQSDGKRFSATVGCNSFAGSYESDGSKLTFGPTAATMMACPPPLDGHERRLASMLPRVHSYRISGETLLLYDAEDKVLADLTAVYLK
jgi:copper homeostasis protein (lipoprotein)